MVENAQGRSHSAAAIVGIVLGVLALVLSWVPFINNFAVPLAVIGVIFAIVGVVGTVRGKKTGKGLAIAAVIVNIIAMAIVLGTQAMYSAAIDHAANGPSATSKSQEKGSDNGSADKGSSKNDYKDLAVGTEVKLENGLTVKLDSVQRDLTNYDGSKIIGIHVTYVNNSDEEMMYNSFDWKGEDAQGAQENAIYYSDGADELNSGTLAAGGTVAGNIYFKDGTVKALYSSSILSKQATASWKLS